MKPTKNNPLLPASATAAKGKNVNPSAIAGEKVVPGTKNGKGRGKAAAAEAPEKPMSAAAQRAKKKMEAAVTRGEELKLAHKGPKLTAAETRALRALVKALPKAEFDTGLKFDTRGLDYVGEDPEPVDVPGGAKIKLELHRRSDTDLVSFAEAHVRAITDNPAFPAPQPTPTVFGGSLATFEALLGEMENLRVAMANMVERRDAARASFINLFNKRATYVELQSNGDPDLIASAGLSIRKSPTKVGELPWPTDVRVDQSQVLGALLITWKAVRRARGYAVECAEVVEGQPRVWKLVSMGGKTSTLQKNLVPGKTYEFRVAAVGGSAGQSEWSPVVSRMAA